MSSITPMWLTNFALVLPDRVVPRGSIRIDGNIIAEVLDHEIPQGIDGHGMTLFPGFIDMHGDMIELELEPRARVNFPISVALDHLDARLAATGVTTAYAAVSFSRAVSGERRSFEHTSSVIQALHEARHNCRVDHRIHARFDITFNNAVGVLRDLLAAGQVDLVSLMDHTPGQGQYRNLEIHIKNRAAQLGISESEARQGILDAKAKATHTQDDLLSNMRQVADMCHSQGVPLASHDDDTIEKVNLMADLGAVIAEFPVTMEAARSCKERNLMTAMGAPNAMRGKSYSGNLSACDAHTNGLLQILAADYHPASILPAIRTLAKTDPDGLPGATRLATSNPAKALNLSDRGEISIGKRADLVAVDSNDRVASTFSAGELIYTNGTLGEPAAQPHKSELSEVVA